MAQHRVVSDYTPVGDVGNTNIKVFVRARPLEDPVETDFIIHNPSEDTKIGIKDPDGASKKKYGEVNFTFDRVMWTETPQDEVFNAMCKPQVDHVLSGYNSCCFAYGQTGSGKTYSMFGEGSDDIRGVIPRAVEYLFRCMDNRALTHEIGLLCSFLEIYNDAIRDLGKPYLVAMGTDSSTSQALFEKTSDIFENLAGKRGNPYFAPAFHRGGANANEMVRPGLKEVQDEYQTMNYEIREDAEGNVFVKDLSLIPVTNIGEVMSLVSMGMKVRATHDTKMNANSSRSHTVFAITVVQKDKSTGQTTTGVLNLIDLAGSERLKKSESQGVRLKEALHINTSLTALGKVVMALDPSSDMSHVPYRDSKLTRVLQNSLGGNAFTVVLVAIHPHPLHYEECLSTLQFANRCRNVRNNPRINYLEDNEDKDRKIKKLQDELSQLRVKVNQLEGGRPGMHHAPSGPAVMATLMTLLKKAGVDAQVAADGGLVLNGQKISPDDLGLDSNSVGEISLTGTEAGDATGGGGGGGARYGGGGGAGSHGNTTRMKKIISDLQEANRVQQQKLKETKMQVDEQGRQLLEATNELTKALTTIRHKDYEYKVLTDEKSRCLKELEDVLVSKHCREMDDLIAHNKEVHKSQDITLRNAPDAFKTYTQLVRKQQETRSSFELPLREEFEKHLLHLEKSRADDIQIIKLQYEHWLVQKDKSLEDFVEKFNSHRTKKSEQLRMCEKEIVRLYLYTEKLEEILDGVERGQYRVQQRQGKSGKTTTGLLNAMGGSGGGGGAAANTAKDGIEEAGAVVLPKGLRPTNPFKQADVDLTLSRKIVQKHKSREEKLEKVKEEAFHRSLAHAAKSGAATMGPIDPILQKQIRDLLVAPGDAKPSSRPQSAAADAARAMLPAVNSDSTVPPFTAPFGAVGRQSGENTNFDSRAESKVVYDAWGTGADDIGVCKARVEIDMVEHKALVAASQELKTLKKEKEMTFEKLSEELSSNETLLYIRHLENEIEKQRLHIRELGLTLQHNKVAQSSLTRLLEKTRVGTKKTIDWD